MFLVGLPSHRAVASGRAVNGVQLGAGGGAVIGTNLFVSASGTGSSCTSVAPCALATARAALSGRGTGTINLSDIGGVYHLASPIALTSADSGETLQATAGAAPVISGAIPITGWTTYSGSIMVANVPAGSYSQDMWSQASGSSIWQRRVRAQALASTLGTFTSNGTGFSGTNTLAFTSGMWARGQGSFPWMDIRCPITAITSSQITLDPQCLGAANNRGGFTSLLRVENSLPLLTQAGQWYLDESAWKLYYWFTPSESSSTTDVELGVLSQLVTGASVSGFTIASNVTFMGTTWNPLPSDGVVPLQSGFVYQTVPSTAGYLFTYTAGGASMAAALTPSAMTFTGSSNITIDATFTAIGNNALAFVSGTHNSTVDESRFTDIGGIAIEVGDAMHATDESNTDPTFVHDITISRNFTAQTGQVYWSSPAIQVGWTTATAITNNEILFSPYDGIQTGGFNCPSGCGAVTGPVSSYASNTHLRNQIHGAMRRQNIVDGGSDYCSGDLATGLSHVITGEETDNQANNYGNRYWDTSSSFIADTNSVIDVSSIGTSCLLFIQVAAGQVGLSNSFTSAFSTVSSACSGFSYDSSNTIGTPSHIANWHDSAAASIVSASGTTIRDPVISYGTTCTQSSIESGYGGASSIVDSDWTNYLTSNIWKASSAPAFARCDLGSAKNLSAFEVAFQWGADVFAERVNWNLQVSNDSSFATGVNTLWSVDTAGDWQTYFSAGMEEIAVNPPISARYFRIFSTSSTPTITEVTGHGT
jgi:hypothetical protein